MCICVGKFSYNIRILSQKFHLASANICSLKTRIPSSLDFLMIFVAWRSPPSVDFARVLSTKSAKKHGFRARSDDSLLPKKHYLFILPQNLFFCKCKIKRRLGAFPPHAP